MDQKDEGEHPILFFDGVCGLCNRLVNFVIRKDQKHIYRFSTLQGNLAKAKLDEQSQKDLDTILILTNDKILRKSSAVLKLLTDLGGICALARVFYLIPENFRDRIYDFVVSHRYQVFGRLENCRLPAPEEKEFFLD